MLDEREKWIVERIFFAGNNFLFDYGDLKVQKIENRDDDSYFDKRMVDSIFNNKLLFV